MLSTSMVLLRTASRRTSPAVGVVVQDLYSVGVGETKSGGRTAASALSRIEAWALQRADGVAVIHDRFKHRVVESLGVPGERIDVIRNWTHVSPVSGFDREAFRAHLGWGDETVVLHTGGMGDKQDLANVVAAGARRRRRGAAVRFVLVGNGKRRAELEVAATGCPAVEILDPLTDDDFVRALSAADVLLVNERPGSVEMAVPSKLTSYFSARRRPCWLPPTSAAPRPRSSRPRERVCVSLLATRRLLVAGGVAACETDPGFGVRLEPGAPTTVKDSFQRRQHSTPTTAGCGSCMRRKHGEMHDEEGTDHRHHRPGRLLPRRAAARQGLRGARPDPSGLDVQHLADRPPLPGPARPERQAVPALRRPVRRRPPGDAAARDRPGRGLQPRGAVARAGQFRRAGAHRRHHRHRRHAAARGGPGGRHQVPLLPGVELGDVRRDAAAAERGDAVLPALALRRGEGLRLLGHQELPRGLRPVRGQRHPLQPRVAAARRDVRDPQGHPRRRADPGRPPGLSSTWATSTRSATGATRRSTSRACGGCCRPTSPTTTCSRPAATSRCATSW